MRNCFLLIFVIISSITLNAQHKGRVIDAISKEPLVMATIELFEQGEYLYTDENGAFELSEKIKEIKIYYPSYNEIKISLKKEYNEITLIPSHEIQEVVFKSKHKPSLNLARKIIQNKDKNEPQSLNSYEYQSYMKFKMTSQKDSLKQFYANTKKPKSENKIFPKSDFFMGERVIQHYFKQKNKHKNRIIAYKLSGIKQSIEEMARFQSQNFSIYDKEIISMGEKYLNPFSKEALKYYKFKIKDTIKMEGRSLIRLKFYPNSKNKKIKTLKGEANVDAQNYAITKWISSPEGNPKIRITQEFDFKLGIWFPKKQIYSRKVGQVIRKIPRKYTNKQGYIVMDSVSKKVGLYLKYYTFFSKRKINQKIEKNTFKGYDYELLENAMNPSKNKLFLYRDKALNQREKQTYLALDSLSGKSIKTYFNKNKSVKNGNLKLGKIDVNLPNMIKYNAYEGFRLGLNFRTNYHFNSRLYFMGNIGYGFKDKAFKYQGEVAYLLRKSIDEKIGVSYLKDVFSIGSIQEISLFEKQNKGGFETYFNNDKFYSSQGISLYYSRDLFSKFHVNLGFSHQKRKALLDYAYRQESNKTFKYKELKLGFTYAPNNQFIQTNYGKVTLKDAYPKLSVFISKGFGKENYTNYSRLDFKLNQNFNHYNFFKKTKIQLASSWLNGDKPITNLLMPNANSMLGNTYLNRIDIAGSHAFETMKIGEFYADKLFQWEIKEEASFAIYKNYYLHPTLIYRGVWGDLESPEQQQGISTESLSKTYHEAGLEFNKLFLKFFGIGAYYRFGAYGFKRNIDNLNLKFTLKWKF